MNLSQANASGVNFDNASFFSTVAGPCAPSSWETTPTCASAAYAMLNNTSFAGAYLNGVDFSNAVLAGASLSHASVMSATFGGANLGTDPISGQRASLDYTLLGGTDFGNVGDLTGASFNDAYGLSTPLITCQLLSGNNTEFSRFGTQANPGYCAPHAPDCTPRTPGHTECVEYATNNPTTWPTHTDGSNICPDGGYGPCDGRWTDGLPATCDPAPPGASCIRVCTFFDPTCTDRSGRGVRGAGPWELPARLR